MQKMISNLSKGSFSGRGHLKHRGSWASRRRGEEIEGFYHFPENKQLNAERGTSYCWAQHAMACQGNRNYIY